MGNGKKLCLIGPANNYHIVKWAKWFSKNNYVVHVISLVRGNIDSCTVYYLGDSATSVDSDIHKLKYFSKVLLIQKLLKEISPDIISVHYASSYGILSALSIRGGYNLSMWGSDVYDFPRKSILHKLLLMISLKSATKLLSTSQAMALEANKYTNKNIQITPFGVDTQLFHPLKNNNLNCENRIVATKNGQEYVVGTVKALEEKYGIRYFIEACAIFVRKYSDVPLRVRIAGKGSKAQEYKLLAKNLGIDKYITWLGFITQEEAAKEWANFDLGVIYSESESFGVSAVEACASGLPVIISDIPGLMEATRPGVSSYVVERKKAKKLCEAMYFLFKNPDIRNSMGLAGRQDVIDRFDIDRTFRNIEETLVSKN